MDLGQIIAGLMGGAPWLANVLIVVGALRLVIKPALAIARSVADYTASDSDNKIVDGVEKSPIYKGLVFVLDWFTSIKPRA